MGRVDGGARRQNVGKMGRGTRRWSRMGSGTVDKRGIVKGIKNKEMV